jgi:hypothetical protein
MNALFKVLGVLLACYVAHALTTGAVFARSGLWGQLFRRETDKWSYWSAIIAYSLLSLACVFVF